MIERIANAIIIKNDLVLLNKKQGRDYFIFPGGKINGNETPEECITRELGEEISGIHDLMIMDKFAEINGCTPCTVRPIHTVFFFVDILFDELWPNGNIKELMWHNGISPIAMSSVSAKAMSKLIYGRYLKPRLNRLYNAQE